MGEFGCKTLTIDLDQPLDVLPESLQGRSLTLSDDRQSISYEYESRAGRSGIGRLLADLSAAGVTVRDVSTRQSSLEDVFLNLLENKA
jgi:ABC-2 type transport system ATP-binding protein